MHAWRWVVAVVVLTVGLCRSSEPKPIVVSPACDAAWFRFALVTVAHGGEQPTDGQRGADTFTDVDEYALGTLFDCANPDEWWAGSEPYRKQTIGKNADRGIVIDHWCAAYEEAEPEVCLAR